jgi:hypothetical protein
MRRGSGGRTTVRDIVEVDERKLDRQRNGSGAIRARSPVSNSDVRAVPFESFPTSREARAISVVLVDDHGSVSSTAPDAVERNLDRRYPLKHDVGGCLELPSHRHRHAFWQQHRPIMQPAGRTPALRLSQAAGTLEAGYGADPLAPA